MNKKGFDLMMTFKYLWAFYRVVSSSINGGIEEDFYVGKLHHHIGITLGKYFRSCCV
jgi:hypothetical protein